MNDPAKTVPVLLTDIVRNARTGDYGTASSLLNRSLVAMQVEFAKGNVNPAVLAQVTVLLDELLRAQQRSDWVAFADVLEYTFIDFWHKNFTAS
jgi:hypothetical protein